MIAELYGLTGSGKTSIAEKLEKKGLKTTRFDSRLEKYINSLFFIIKNPITSFRLFLELNNNSCISIDQLNISQRTKLKIMRNILLLSTMAHYNKALADKNALIDEGFFQMLHTIYERKKDSESIKRLTDRIPKPDILIIVNIKKPIRIKRLKERNLPRKDLFGHIYFDNWHDSMQYNDRIIKKIIKKDRKIKAIEVKNESDIKNLNLFS